MLGTSADSLSGTTTARPTFTPTKPGTYIVRLRVDDGMGGSHTDDVAVTVTVPTVGVADATITEGHRSTAMATFAVTLSPAGTLPVTVAYGTGTGTATAGATGSCGTRSVDYDAAQGTLTFRPDATSQTVAVTVCGDRQKEADETFTLILSTPTHATLARDQATGTIANDDAAEEAQPSISVTDAQAAEGAAATFSVILSATSPQVVIVAYATVDGTATASAQTSAPQTAATYHCAALPTPPRRSPPSASSSARCTGRSPPGSTPAGRRSSPRRSRCPRTRDQHAKLSGPSLRTSPVFGWNTSTPFTFTRTVPSPCGSKSMSGSPKITNRLPLPVFLRSSAMCKSAFMRALSTVMRPSLVNSVACAS